MNRNVMGNITPRVVNYRNNGTSRDTYVSYNCGGYHVQKSQVPSNLHVHKKTFSLNKFNSKSTSNLNPLMKHYFNDGQGRDVYISCNDGGSSNNYGSKKDPIERFQKSLRSYNQIIEPKSILVDTFTRSQFQLSKKEQIKNKQIAKSQRNLLNRLYQELPKINKKI